MALPDNRPLLNCCLQANALVEEPEKRDFSVSSGPLLFLLSENDWKGDFSGIVEKLAFQQIAEDVDPSE
jgi:hypothetical protein